MLQYFKASFVLLSFFLSNSMFAQSVWINEIHYDNTGTDVNEGFEIMASSGTDLSCYTVYHINGAGGGIINSTVLSGIVGDLGCGLGAIWFSTGYALQNGSDGLAIYNTCTSTLVQFISYEGTPITATAGPIGLNGATSIVIGVTETSSTATTESLQLNGTGSSYGDFTWSSYATSTQDALNTTQTISPCSSNTITPTSSPGPFNINCSTSTSASSNVSFTSTGTFNVGNTFTVQISDASGSFASPTDIGTLTGAAAEGLDPFGSINFIIPENFVSGAGYIIQIISDDPFTISSLTSAFTITQDVACSITPGTITGDPFSVDCSAPTTDSGTIDFTSFGNFNIGNTFTVELSDASGSFANPTVIGSFSGASAEGSDPSGTIGITIPSNFVDGSNYVIRIISSDIAMTSTLSSTITITQIGSCTPPYITSIIINSCQVGCTEGHNEIVFANTGDYSIDMNASNFEFLYQSVYPPTNTYTDVVTTNPTTTTELNDSAGCPGLFVEGVGETIPPNASIMLVRNTICPEALDWTSLCGSGPIYVVYTTDPTWSTNGNFNNSAGGPRYFESSFITTSGDTITTEYEYNSDDLTLHSDGDFVTFSTSGGLTNAYGNNGCTLDPVVLSSNLLDFYGVKSENRIDLLWSISSQVNNDYFYIDHSTDGQNWTFIDEVPGHGTSTSTQYYSTTHDRPSSGINYYALYSVDFDGTSYRKSIIAVNIEVGQAYFNSLTQTIYFTEKIDVIIYSMDGKIIGEYIDVREIKFDDKGVFIMRNIQTGEVQRIFAN